MTIEEQSSYLPVLETKRLLLRSLSMNDAEDIFEYASDPEVPKYSVWSVHESIEDTKDFLEAVMEEYSNYELATWGIVHKVDNKLIGTCGLGN